MGTRMLQVVVQITALEPATEVTSVIIPNTSRKSDVSNSFSCLFFYNGKIFL